MSKHDQHTEITARDGQYSYIKTEADDCTWIKMRLADKVKVGELVVKPDPHQASKTTPGKKHDHYGTAGWWAQHQGNYQSGSTGITVLPKPAKLAPEKETSFTKNYHTHDGKALVFEADGRQFFAAGYGDADPADYAMVLDLANLIGPHRRFWTRDAIIPPSGKKWLALNSEIAVGKDNVAQGTSYVMPVMPQNVVHFNWPDGGIIRGAHTFWEKLFAQMPKGKILVCCFGGHGRTGTALACLLMITGLADSSYEAILTVRAQHCEHAVETTTQVEYLDALAYDWGLGQHGKDANKVPMGGSAAALAAHKQQAAKAAKKG